MIAAAFACFFSLVVGPGQAAQVQSSITGAIVDPLGARVPGATVVLTRDGRRIAETSSDAHGQFTFQALDAGRYQITARATGFDSRLTDPFYLGATDRIVVDIALQIGLKQEVVVTAAATELPQSQVGAQVTVIDHDALQNLSKLDVLEAIRTAPGVQVVQVGARGGVTSLFVRGGNSNFNKVLLDGVAANDIGVVVDLSQFAATGVDRVEVLRESNSVLYGSDALTLHGMREVSELAVRSVSGEHTAAAAFDMSRTICRRAERAVVRLSESGEAVPPAILAYVNRLSDLLWLFARKLEHDAGISGSLREATGKAGNRWSRAW